MLKLRIIYLLFILFCVLFSHIDGFAASRYQLNIEEELNRYKQQTLLSVSTELDSGVVSNANVVSMSILCVSPYLKYNRKEKRIIERLIKTFPDTIVRKDTLSFYIQHILCLSYNEFVKKDYKRALYVVNNFHKNVPQQGFIIKNLLDSTYSVFNGMLVKSRLEKKAEIKHKPIKSWITINIGNDSIISSWIDDYNHQNFILDIVDDIPIQMYNPNIVATALYSKKTNDFLGGSYSCPSNIQKAIRDLFGITIEPTIKKFEIPQSFSLMFLPVEKQIENINNNILNKHAIEQTSNNIITLLDQKFGQYNYLIVCEYCAKYEPFISSKDKPIFYNLWALSETFLGRYEKSINYFTKALTICTNSNLKKTIHLNMGYALCETGNYNEALHIFDLYKNSDNSDFENFLINDYYAYLYSSLDKQKSLNYYKTAEKYLDETNFYSEKKIRHFVNKSKVAESKYNQQICLEQAMSYFNYDINLLGLTADSISLGTIYAELGAFYNSVSKYNEADKYYKLATQCYSKLTKYDKRRTTLELSKAINFIDIKEYDGAIETLENIKYIKYELFGNTHIEYFQVVQLLFKAYILSNKVNAQHLLEYTDLLQSFPLEKETYQNLDVMSLYYISTGEYSKAIALLEFILNAPKHTSTIKLISRFIPILDKCSSQQYEVFLSHIVNHIKDEVCYTFTQLSTLDRTGLPILLNEILGHSINGIYRNSQSANTIFELSLFSKGLLIHTQQKISNLLSNHNESKSDWENVKHLRNLLNQAITHGDSIQFKSLHSQIEQIERNLTYKFVGMKVLQKNLDIRINDVLNGIG